METSLTVSRSIQASSDLKICLLGPFRLYDGSREIVLKAIKDRALLAYLASTPGEGHLRRQLAYLLWPDSEEARARESVKQALLRLKRCLPDHSLVADRHSAALSMQPDNVDIIRLQNLITTDAHGSVMSAFDMLDSALLIGLEDISSEFDDWREQQQACVIDGVKVCALTLMSKALQSANMDNAEALAVRLVNLDPLCEDAIQCLIHVYQADGRTSKAYRVYQTFKRRLQEELGVEPELNTQRLIRETQQSACVNAQDQAHPMPRIAVLAFEADDSSQRYFADGLTDDITTDLARNKSLDVLPATGIDELHADMSSTLSLRGVTHVLHGSVRRADGRLRVNTRLVDTKDNQIVWAQRYDRSMAGVFDMQDAISSQIVTRLQVELLPDADQRVDHGTRNASAYEMFHKGRSLYLRGMNNHSLRAAKALLERAIDLDPGFARAYAQLAICESYLAMSIVNKTGEDYSAYVLEHGLKALAMNPDLALGHAAVGLAYYASGLYQEAEVSLQNAIKLDDKSFEAQLFLARNRRLQGDHDGAIQRFRIASALRLNDFRSSGLLGDALLATDNREEAMEAFAVSVARITVELDRHPDNAGALAFGAPMLAELGRVEQAQDWCDWALAIEPDDCLLRYNLARLSAILGDKDQAMAHLEAAFSAPFLVQQRLALWMTHDQDFASLTSSNRFQHFLAFARLSP